MVRSRPKETSRIRLDPTRASHVAEILKALAHPLRIQIVAILVEGPEHVSSLSERLGVKQAIVSQQLRILRMRGLVKAVRVDGFAHYHVSEPQLRQLVLCMESCAVR
jgi:DNA-binding transcriptional ArsR family regulator